MLEQLFEMKKEVATVINKSKLWKDKYIKRRLDQYC